MINCEVCGEPATVLTQDIVQEDPEKCERWVVWKRIGPVHPRCYSHPRRPIHYWRSPVPSGISWLEGEAGFHSLRRWPREDELTDNQPISALPPELRAEAEPPV